MRGPQVASPLPLNTQLLELLCQSVRRLHALFLPSAPESWLKDCLGGETVHKAVLKIFPKKLTSFATENEEVQA